MPTYVYRCPACGKTEELVQKITEKQAPMCPDEECKTRMESVISATSFILKGSGWAKDGYK